MNYRMKKRLIAWLTVGVLAFSFFSEGMTGPLLVKAAASAVYVDAAAGDDSNPGSLEQPVKTLAKAKELARGMTGSGDVTVYLRGGTYVLDNTLTFDAQDSGKNGNVTWTAYENEKPVISGGTALTGWTLVDAEKNIWSAPAQGIESRDFYVDGERATLARAESFGVIEVSELFRTLILDSGDMPSSFARPQDLEVVIRAVKHWSILPVESVATEGNYTLTMEAEAWASVWALLKNGFVGETLKTKYVQYIQNAYEFLDEAGEWYLNADTDTVYYIPREGQDMTGADAVLCRLENLFVLDGAENLTFKGLTFAYTTWLQANTSEGVVTTKQSGIMDATSVYPTGLIDMASTAALYATNVNNVQITGNTFEHMGYGGVYLEKGTKNSAITFNTLNDLGGSAVALGSIQASQVVPDEADLAENNVISDNTITNFGAVYKSSTGISLGSVARTTVEYNTIDGGASRGITISSWDGVNGGKELLARECVTTDNLIAHNWIKNLTMESNYCSGIYGVGRMDRTVIISNVIEMVPTADGGIHLAAGAHGFAATNNAMIDCQKGVHHEGNYNNLYNNYKSKGNASSAYTDGDINSPARLGVKEVCRFEDNRLWDESAVNALKAAAGVDGRAADYTDPEADVPVISGAETSTLPADAYIPEKPDNTLQAEIPEDAFKIYVDAVNGDDAGAGTLESPVKTLEKAKELAKAQTASQSQDVAVLLREGTYMPEETLTFDAGDSGKNGHKVIWAAYGDENPVISGGTPITGWTLADAEKNIWSAPAQGIESRDFYVNGKSAVRARSEVVALDLNLKKGVITLDKYGLPEEFARVQDLEISMAKAWRYQIKHVESVNLLGKLFLQVTCTADSWEYEINSNTPMEAENVQYLENAYELLDEPGEWYLNTEEDVIYYMPEADQDINSLETVLGRLENLVVFEGDADNVVENITLEGLTFSHTTWVYPNGAAGLRVNQASQVTDHATGGHTVPSTFNSIYGTYVNNINIINNTFRQLGNGGVDLGRATKNSAIAYNAFEELGAGAVVLGRFDFPGIDQHPETSAEGLKALTENNTVAHNYIKDVSRTFKSCAGILVGFTAKSKIEYNTLINLPYTGISAGWGWGNGDFISNDFALGESSISYNAIVKAVSELRDGGAIYVLGRQDNTQIAGNYVTHSGDKGIYLDDGAWGYTVTDNVVTNSYCNFLYKGDGNKIYDNYTTSGETGDESLRVDIPEAEGSFYVFERNDLWDETKVEEIKTAAGAKVMTGRDFSDSAAPEGGNLTLWIAVVTASVLCAAGVAVVLVYRKKRQKSK